METIKNATASICLYGTPEIGIGYLAEFGEKRFGDGEPHPCVNSTKAIAHACVELARAGAQGTAVVFDAGGERCADVCIESPARYGALDWRPAPVYTIDADSIIAESRRQSDVKGGE